MAYHARMQRQFPIGVRPPTQPVSRDYISPNRYGGFDGALGADAVPAGDPKVRLLQQQVNRFVPSKYTQPVAVDGAMSHPLASYATGIMLDRATRALATFGAGEPATGFYHKAFADALTHVAMGPTWVKQNLDVAIKDVSDYANFLGLPPAEGGTIQKLISDWRVWVAAAGVGILVFGRRRRSR